MKWVCLIVCLFLAGCNSEEKPHVEPGVLPPPQIKVQTDETLDGIKLVITYDGEEASNPESPERNRQQHTLSLNEEQLADYRKQVEFLLGKIDEAQQKQEIRAKPTVEDYLGDK